MEYFGEYMPIKPENLKLYPTNWKSEIRPAILRRAGNRCEKCGVENHTVAWRRRGERLIGVKIVLTIAHLDHDPRNCAPENLLAMCQKCHLSYDQQHHLDSSRKTRRERKAVGNLPGIE